MKEKYRMYVRAREACTCTDFAPLIAASSPQTQGEVPPAVERPTPAEHGMKSATAVSEAKARNQEGGLKTSTRPPLSTARNLLQCSREVVDSSTAGGTSPCVLCGTVTYIQHTTQESWGMTQRLRTSHALVRSYRCTYPLLERQVLGNKQHGG